MLKLPAYLPRAVPWIDWNEWIQVKVWLYDDMERNIKKALQRMNTWYLRSGGKLPVAIECTSSIYECECHNWYNSSSIMQKRLVYSMIIIRLVNGVVDREQKGKHAKSIIKLARNVGLPRILVDIRHEATHASLPSLELLEMGIELTKTWLKEAYWDEQHRHFTHVSDELRIMLRSYKSSMRADNDKHNAVSMLVNEIETCISPASEAIQAFLIPMLLEPSEKFVLKLPKKHEHICVDKKIELIFAQSKKMWIEPLTVFGERFPLFRSGFLLDASRQLIKQSSMYDDDSRKNEWECSLLFHWIKELLQTQFPFVTNADTIVINDEDTIVNKNTNIVDLPAISNDILRMCLQCLNHWTSLLASIVFDIVLRTNTDTQIYRENQEIIKGLIAFHTRPTVNNASVTTTTNDNDDETITLLEKLNTLCNELERKNSSNKRRKLKNDDATTSSSSWQISEKFDKTRPIGS